MTAPRDIVDSLESVLGVYFSGIRHNLRAAFILCDGLVELTCKAKVESHGVELKEIKFKPLLKHQHVGLDPGNGGVGKKCEDSHKVRNKMHHVNAAATVDAQRCADALLDAVDCMEHCFPGAKLALEDKIKVAIRVVQLFSSSGNGGTRSDFQREMNDHGWRTRDNAPRRNEFVVSPGMRSHWSLVIFDSTSVIETILNRIGAP